MVRAWLVPVLLAVFLAPTVRGADADKAAEAAAAFQSLYGAELDRLRASRDPKESVGLATKLLAAAKQTAVQPELVAVLCEKAYELAMAHPDGYITAAEAIQLEAATVPDKAAACADRLVEVRQRQFDQAKGDARPSAGETLIDAVLAAVEARKKAGVLADEIVSYKRALMVARVIKSDRAGELETHVKALEQAIRLAVEIENLKKLIAADPKNQAARQRLVRLHLVDLDDPAEAAKLLEGVEDASLLKYVPAAAKPVETVPEFACLELGEWYRSLADAAPPAAKAFMFARAKAYCERFLQLHAAEDINRSKAALALQKIEEGLRAAPPARTAPQKAAGWIDLLALVDPAKDTIKGTWERQGAGVASVGEVPSESRFVVPIAVQGSYELDVTFTRTSGSDMVGIVAPVGTTSVLVAVSAMFGQVSGLSRINGKNSNENETTIRPGRFENGRPHTLAVKVAIESDDVSIGVQLDGRPYLNWKGPVAAITVSSSWRIPTAGAIGIGASNCKIEFSGARLRMLSGEARPLRAVEKPATGAAKAPPRTKQGPGGQPIDLLALVDPETCVVSGKCRREAEAIVVSGRIMLPVIVSGSYDLTVALKRTGGGDTVGIILPVGSKTVLLGLGYYGNIAHGLDQVNGKNGADPANPTVLKPAKLENNREYVAHVRVLVEGALADIQVDLDDKKIISWHGLSSAFTMYEGWRLPQATRIGLGVSNGSAAFSSARLLMLSGEAKVLAPAGAAK